MKPIQTLRVKRLHPDAKLPEYATSGAACFDLVAWGERHYDIHSGVHFACAIEGGSADVFRTGLAFAIPQGFAMLIFSRSGHGFKRDTRLANCVGVIDSDYRGEVLVKLRNDGESPVLIEKGDRIAQAMLVELPAVRMLEVDELDDTARGAGGFGSTGA